MKNLKATVRISRYSRTNTPDGVSISIRDNTSGVVLADLDLTLEQYAEAITGLLVDDVSCKTDASDRRIGLKRKVEPREVFCPHPRLTRAEYSEWLKGQSLLSAAEESSFSLGSKHSIQQQTGGTLLRYWVESWPDEPTSSPG